MLLNVIVFMEVSVCEFHLRDSNSTVNFVSFLINLLIFVLCHQEYEVESEETIKSLVTARHKLEQNLVRHAGCVECRHTHSLLFL